MGKSRRFVPPGYMRRLEEAIGDRTLQSIADASGLKYWEVQNFAGGAFGGEFAKWERFTAELGIRWQWLLTDEGERKLMFKPPGSERQRSAPVAPEPDAVNGPSLAEKRERLVRKRRVG